MKNLCVVVFLLFATTMAGAEEASGGDRIVYKKKTIIDFSEVTIEGELTKPEGSYIVNRKVSRFSKLIRIRENFVPELLGSANEL